MVSEQKYAIRFGLGAIKAVGFNMIETVILERNKNGKFKDLYDFSKRVGSRSRASQLIFSCPKNLANT